MKYLRKFDSIEEYKAFINSAEFVSPNVCLIGVNQIEYNPLPIPLYIEAVEDLNVSFSNPIQYSMDLDSWIDLPVNTATPTIAAGSKVYFRAENLSPASSTGIGTFSITGKCNVGGNIMSMAYGSNFANKFAISNQAQFRYLFKNCTNIITADKLRLPATSLYKYCYANMFEGCTSLEVAPELPAIRLVDSCYNFMFANCSKLKYIKAMFTTTPGVSYTYNWVGNVATTGIFVKNAAATWDDTSNSGVPSGWAIETATE